MLRRTGLLPPGRATCGETPLPCGRRSGPRLSPKGGNPAAGTRHALVRPASRPRPVTNAPRGKKEKLLLGARPSALPLLPFTRACREKPTPAGPPPAWKPFSRGRSQEPPRGHIPSLPRTRAETQGAAWPGGGGGQRGKAPGGKAAPSRSRRLSASPEGRRGCATLPFCGLRPLRWPRGAARQRAWLPQPYPPCFPSPSPPWRERRP